MSITADAVEQPSSAPVLTVDDLSISFEIDKHWHPAVRGAAFELRRGRVLALVGESGSGKSVTAMAALGLLPGNARVTGSITLDGRELVGADPGWLREARGGRIGTVFQEPMSALNPVFTIGAQIAEAIRTHRPLSRKAAHERTLELLTLVGLADPLRVAKAFPHELSGGQLQRAMIAMAVSCDPAVLIADEPTTALDVTVQAGILDLLRDLCGRLNTAVLLITHDMGVVADLADEVVVLRAGQVLEHAPVRTLFAEPAHAYTTALLAAVPRLPELQLALVPEENPSGADELSLLVDEPIPEPASRPDVDPVVLFQDVVVEYPGRRRHSAVRAVDGVDLRIGPAEVLGLVGESGSGKSTIGRAVAGLVPVTSGTVRVDGIDVAAASRRGLLGGRRLRGVRARMGIVFQDPASALNPRHTVGDSIAEPLTLHSELDATARRRRVGELLDAVQLGARLRDRYPHEMSGGQRQRVVIARALALNPALLIADEPTSALDVSVQARILELLRELQRSFGFGCLFISHDLAVIGQLADRVAVLHRGRIVEQGPTGSVLRSPQHAYTQRLLAAAPVADPVQQHGRREAWRRLAAPDPVTG